MPFPFRGEQTPPGDFSLNPTGDYEYPPDVQVDNLYARDGAISVPPSDFYGIFYPQRVLPEHGPSDIAVGNWFVVAGAGTDAVVRFSQSFDDGYTYAGSWTWQDATTVTVGEGRTLVMPLAPEYRDGARLADGGPLLRVEVLSGTLNLDTIEMQLEPAGGLLVPTGWEWSGYVPAQQVALRPLRSARLTWEGTAERDEGAALPSVSELNSVYAEAVAGDGTIADGVASFTEADPGESFEGDLTSYTSYTFQWVSDGSVYYARASKTADGVTFYWDAYPANFHEVYPPALSAAQPADPPPYWETEDATYTFDPADEWDTLGWSAALNSAGINYDVYLTNGTEPPDAYGRHAFTLQAGAVVPHPGGSSTGTVGFPVPLSGPFPSVTSWDDHVVGGDLAGYVLASPLGELAVPSAGSDLTFIDNGVSGELESYPFGPGVTPGVSVSTGASLAVRLRVAPPQVRWKQVTWGPSPEAAGQHIPRQWRARPDGLAMSSTPSWRRNHDTAHSGQWRGPV